MTLRDMDGIAIATVSLLQGSLPGLPATILDQPYSMTCIAKAGAEVEFVGRNLFAALMTSKQPLAFLALRVMAGEVQSMRSALASASRTLGLHPLA